jgi:oligo-1,6-glucosidase
MCTNVPGIHEIIHELHEKVFGPSGVFTVGEGAGVTSENALSYIAEDRGELDTVYHFELAGRSKTTMKAADFRRVQKAWQKVQKNGGWETQHFSNHDSPRQVSAYGAEGQYRAASARLLAVLLLTAPGTPILYQGEEIGMINVTFDRIEDYNDRYTVGDYHSMTEKGADPREALRILAPKSRDNARTPYQWDGSRNAGFTKGMPWLKVNPCYSQINLQKDLEDPAGVFQGYQELIRIRKDHPVILDGELCFYMENDPQIVAYTRENEEEILLILANLSGEAAELNLPGALTGKNWKLLFAGRPECSFGLKAKKSMAPWESEVYLLTD